MSKPRQAGPGAAVVRPPGARVGRATMADLSGFGCEHGPPSPRFDHAECPGPTQWDRLAGVPRGYGCAKRGRGRTRHLRIPCKVLNGPLTRSTNDHREHGAGGQDEGPRSLGSKAAAAPLLNAKEHPTPGQRRAPTTINPLPSSGELVRFVLELPGEGHSVLPGFGCELTAFDSRVWGSIR